MRRNARRLALFQSSQTNKLQERLGDAIAMSELCFSSPAVVDALLTSEIDNEASESRTNIAGRRLKTVPRDIT